MRGERYGGGGGGGGGRGEGGRGGRGGGGGRGGWGGKGLPLDRPLCSNCGRRSLQRVLEMTELIPPAKTDRDASRLPQTPSLPSVEVERRKLRVEAKPPDRGDADRRPPPNNLLTEHRSLYLAPNQSGFRIRADQRRREIIRGHAKCIRSRGRFAEWVCRSDALLCSPCLQALRSFEVALERVETPW